MKRPSDLIAGIFSRFPPCQHEVRHLPQCIYCRRKVKIMVQESRKLSQDPSDQVPSGKGREVEVAAVAKRRQFSTAYKRQIVRQAAACEAVGGIGKLLREEGLYSSHLAKWRRELEAGEDTALAAKRRGPKVDVTKAQARRVEGLERENSRLRQKLIHAEHIIAAQKKLCELLGLPTGEEATR